MIIIIIIIMRIIIIVMKENSSKKIIIKIIFLLPKLVFSKFLVFFSFLKLTFFIKFFNSYE